MGKIVSPKPDLRAGFTLIELSIVLVIIGLIVSGVLVGQDLVRAAAVRSTIAQIERYRAAVNTFKGKYNALPGDIADPGASSFGFAARGICPGQGDGNGLIEGFYNFGCYSRGADQAGETMMFWVDLSTARMIDGGFSAATPAGFPNATFTSTPPITAYLPPAKLGLGQYIYVYSAYSNNYFGIIGVTLLGGGGALGKTYTLPVAIAYSIDQKTDDGFPQAGNVTASYGAGQWQFWTGAGGSQTNSLITAATPGSSSTCFDNGNVANAQQQYSIEISGGTNPNCTISLRFQ